MDASVDGRRPGNGNLHKASTSNTRNAATDPRKTNTMPCAWAQATSKEHATAPIPQKKFNKLTAAARDPVLTSATIKLSVGITSPNPRPSTATDAIPTQAKPT